MLSDTYPHRNPKIKAKLLPGGNLVVFGPKSSWAFILNRTASVIWEFSDGKHSLNNIESIAKQLPHVESSILKTAELQAFVDQLVGYGLLHIDTQNNCEIQECYQPEK